MSDGQSRRFGKYLLLDRIGAGGMAEVYRAKRFGAKGFAKYLALKRIRPDFNDEDEFIQMFIDEAKILVNLSHPNIVQVFDFGIIEDNYFISMEHVAGCQLSSLVRRVFKSNRRLPLAASIFVAKEVASGLGYAHSQHDAEDRPLGLVHRDIGPQNVMVSWHGAVKILDFGVARAANKLSSSNAGQLKGKFAYMSPEQAAGAEVDWRTDLFACGIMLWEMIAARRLFKADSEIRTLRLVQACQIPLLSEVAAPIPLELDQVVAKALAKNPEQRYQSGTEMERELTRLLHSVHPGFTPEELATIVRDQFAKEIDRERAMMRKYERSLSQYGLTALLEDENLVETVSYTDTEVDPDEQETSASIPGAKTVSDHGVVRGEPPLPTPTAAGELHIDDFAPDEPLSDSQVSWRGGVGRRGILIGAALIGLVTAALFLMYAGIGTDDRDESMGAAATSPPAEEHEGEDGAPGLADDTGKADGDGDTEKADGDDTGKADGDDTEKADGDDTEKADGDDTEKADGDTPVTAAPAATSSSAPATAKRPLKKKAKTARLSINSKPWAKIYINGRDTGKTTPVKSLSVPAGKIRIRLVNPGKGISAERTLVLKPGATGKVLETLK